MTISFLRKASLALVAIAGLSAAPAFAGGYGADEDVIFADDGYNVVREDQYRPQPRRNIEPQWEQDTDFISPRQVSRILRRQGYGQVTEIALRGDVYRVIAVRHNGALVKLNVDAENGYVLSARRIGWAPRREIRPRPGVTIEFGWDGRG